MKTRLKTEPMRLYSKALLLNLCLLLVAVSTVHAGDNNLLSTVKTDQILPVTFHSFTTTLEKNHVVLKWSVDTDDNFSLYVIERSLDGKNFKADKTFAFQRVSLDTKLIAIQDVEQNLFQFLYGSIKRTSRTCISCFVN